MPSLFKNLCIFFFMSHSIGYAMELDRDIDCYVYLDAPEGTDLSDSNFSLDSSGFTVHFDTFGSDSFDHVQTAPSNESSHAWDSMPNHNDSSFDDAIRLNAQDSMAGWQQDLQNNREYSQNNHPENATLDAEQTIEVEAPSQPAIPLWDTIGALENFVKSEEGKDILDTRIERLTEHTRSFLGIGNRELKKELAFLEMVQDGEVSKLLMAVQGAKIDKACEAFEKLTEIWPYKHDAHFLVLRGYQTGEDKLVRLLGRNDLMKQTEATLVSRPDFLRLSPEAQYRFTHFKKEYDANQKYGNEGFLRKEFNHLHKLLHSKEYRNDKAMLTQYLYLKLMLADPITTINATIAHGPQKKAIHEIRTLSRQIDYYFAQNKITDPEAKYAHMMQSGMLEKYNNAQRLLESRPDFAQIMQSDLITASYSVMEVGRALRENSELLGICQHYEFQHTDHLKARISELEQIKFRPMVAVYQEYDIAPEIGSFMTAHGLHVQDYQYCYGDRLVQANHREHLSIITQTAALDHSSTTYAYTDCILNMVDAARELNQAGEPLKAMAFADVCWSIFECGRAICEGVVEGAVNAVVDMIKHPISTTTSVVFAPYLLTYQVSKIALDLSDIGLTALMNKDLGKQKWDDYIKPISDCIDIITSSEVALQDKLKLGASITTQLLVQRKALSGLGKFYNVTKARALDFVKNNPLATPEQYLVTADGKMLRAGNESAQNLRNGKHAQCLHEIENRVNRQDYAHSLIHAEELSASLQVEEITSIINVTKHGIERLIQRGFTPDDLLKLINKPDYLRLQTDGAQAFITKINDKYNLLIINPISGKVVTGLKKISEKALHNQGRKYGWKI